MPDDAASLPRRRILALCCLGMLTLGLVGNVPALCLTQVAGEFALDKAASGLFIGCMFWGLVTSILIAGPLADRVGFRYLMAAAAVFEAAGMCLVAFSGRAWTAYAGEFVAGVGMGIFDALVTPLACAVYPRARARVASLLHSFYPFGMFLVVLVFLLLTRLGWTWRSIYVVVGLSSIPAGALFLVVRLPTKAHEGEERLTGRKLLRGGVFWFLLAAILLAGTAELGFSQWLPAYIEWATRGTQAGGALALLLFGAAMTAGRLGNSALAHRIRPRALYAWGAAVCVAALLAAAIPGPRWLTPVAAVLFGLGVCGLWPMTLAMAGDRFPRAGASMYSLLHAAGNLGGFVGPLAVGVMAKSWRLEAGYAALALAPLAGIVVVCALRSPEARRDA